MAWLTQPTRALPFSNTIPKCSCVADGRELADHGPVRDLADEDDDVGGRCVHDEPVDLPAFSAAMTSFELS